MAPAPLTGGGLPRQPELQAFARAAAHLLTERAPRTPGSRTVARRAGTGIQHLDHRDYAPGDDVRHIDWRQTARQRRPILRRFESESAGDWTLLLDASSSMAAHGGAKWQAAVNMAAAMAYALLHGGHRVGLMVFGARVLAECSRGRGQHHYAALAQQLKSLRPADAGERTEAGVCARRLQGAASVLLLGDGLAADGMRRDLLRLRERCSALHVLQLRDDQDLRIPDDYAVTSEIDLVDAETGACITARTGDRAHAMVAAEHAALTARLRGVCGSVGAVFTDCDVATPWQHTLLGHLLRARAPC